MKPYKICCITYKALDSLVKETLLQHPDPEMEVTIVEGLQDEVVVGLREAELAGSEVAIGGGANLKIAMEFVSIPVIEYRLSAYDYLEAVDKSFVLGSRIAICTYRAPANAALIQYLENRGIDITNIIYDTDDDLRRQLLLNKDKVIIGSAHPADLSTKLGIKNVLIYPGQGAVLVAFRDAKALAAQMRVQNERRKFAQAVINNSPNGIVLVDSESTVIDYNSAAQQLFGKEARFVKGSYASQTIPDSGIDEFVNSRDIDQTLIRKVQGEDVLCKWVRLEEKYRGTIGIVGIFSKMSDIIRVQLEYQRRQLEDREKRGFSAKAHFRDMVGNAPSFMQVKEEASLFAKSSANILISGETGVGKEIFAQSIHNESERKKGPFVAINCAALPEHLLESELFGYDEGAFTGGKRGGKKGLFELASFGTIFLDEIGELSSLLQSHLLRVLQEKEIMRVGGDRVIPVDVRVITATNRDLHEIATDKFRRDLYYRISVLELNIPPLQKREKDAVLLFEHFLNQRSNLNTKIKHLPQEVIDIIMAYSWPGNIRELQNVSERFSIYLESSSEHGSKFLRRSIIRAIGEPHLLSAICSSHNFPQRKASAELIEKLQTLMGYNKSQASEKLGLSRTTLWRMEKNES